VLIYLGLSAVVVFIAALVLLQSASLSPPAVAHLVLAVGIAPLILGAITHFMPVLTRSGSPRRGLSWAPLLLQCAGGTAFSASPERRLPWPWSSPPSLCCWLHSCLPGG
jgi:hypothetical protein